MPEVSHPDQPGRSQQISALRSSDARPRSRAIKSFVQTDVGAYFIGLLVTDLAYSCGFALEVLPIVEYYSYHGRACSYQGFAYAFGVRPRASLFRWPAVLTLANALDPSN